jgi:hypothetical protein
MRPNLKTVDSKILTINLTPLTLKPLTLILKGDVEITGRDAMCAREAARQATERRRAVVLVRVERLGFRV